MLTDETARTLWVALRAQPTRALDTPPAVVEMLLAWNDRNGDFGDMGPGAARYTLLRMMAAEVVEAYDSAQLDIARCYGEPDPTDDDAADARAEELACLIDPARAEEARGMVDDWEARLGVQSHIADALREAIETNSAIFQKE
jgi:hypothetical protein